jgi:hypothetical protein
MEDVGAGLRESRAMGCLQTTQIADVRQAAGIVALRLAGEAAWATPPSAVEFRGQKGKNMGVASRVADYAQKPALHEGRGMVAGQ